MTSCIEKTFFGLSKTPVLTSLEYYFVLLLLHVSNSNYILMFMYASLVILLLMKPLHVCYWNE